MYALCIKDNIFLIPSFEDHFFDSYWSYKSFACSQYSQKKRVFGFLLYGPYIFPTFLQKKNQIRPVNLIWLDLTLFYSRTLVITPEPTVLPPSLTANLSCSSNATGVINLTFISTLSPGIIISTPSGSWISPVTSVVRI